MWRTAQPLMQTTAHANYHQPHKIMIKLTLSEKSTDAFIDLFGTRNGRWLANRLGLQGKGSVRLANLVSGYFWNMRAAMWLDRINKAKGDTKAVNIYKLYCDDALKLIYSHPLFHQLPF